MAATRYTGASKLPMLPAPTKSDSPRHSPQDFQIVPRSYQHSRLDHLEDRVLHQERTTQNLVDKAYKIKEDIIDNLNYTHGSWQDEKHARELLQEHIRTITEVVRKLSRDIQIIEDQIRHKDSYVEGTSNAVKNLEVHHVAGLTDLRGRVARCDASIARLSGDLKACYDSIKALGQQQQDNQNRVFQRIQEQEQRMSELVTQLEKVHAESSIQLRQVEGGSSHQISALEGRALSKIDEAKQKVRSLQVQEQTERGRLEMRLSTNLDQALAKIEARFVQHEKHLEEMVGGLAKRIDHLEQQAAAEHERSSTSHQALEAKVTNNISAANKQHQAELSRLKKECREGFSTVHETISNMKQVMDGKRKLLEEQLRQEINNIRRMVVLI